ncbi:MAG: restriction endonuclease subunit S, partial [Sphaerospermopsis kisseleviana]
MSIPDGFKVSEVGVIPVDWDVKRLGDVADVIMGQSPLGSSYNQKGEGIPLINGPTEFTNRYPIKIQWTNSPTKICQLGDILLCIRGSSTGRMNISNDEYCIGRGVAAIIAKSNCTNSFLEFQVYNAVKLILKLSVGSTFPNIDSKSLKNLQIPLPPL